MPTEEILAPVLAAALLVGLGLFVYLSMGLPADQSQAPPSTYRAAQQMLPPPT
jgi:hypothetical protein